MADDFIDFYSLLGVPFGATSEEVKGAYRQMAMRYHPDRHPEDAEASTARFRLIQNAYEMLSDPAQRRRYDREWRRNHNFEEPPEPSGPIEQVPQADWDFACRYYPDLLALSARLAKFSGADERRWRNLVFFERAFDQAVELARAAEEAILGKMVGASETLRMVARDALLASHDALLIELATALRVLGPDATEKVVFELCSTVISAENKSKHEAPLRIERYRSVQIKVMPSLACYIDYYDEWFKYIFEARAAVDARKDRNTPIEHPAEGLPRRRRA